MDLKAMLASKRTNHQPDLIQIKEDDENQSKSSFDNQEDSHRFHSQAIGEFYNQCHSPKNGQFCEVHQITHTVETVSHEEKIEAKRKARNKVRIAPVPDARDIQRKESSQSDRSGGDSRTNSKARDVLSKKLWEEFGGPKKGYVVDPASGIKMHYSEDSKENPNGYPVFTLGRIFTGRQGGGYAIANLLPELFQSNRSRGNRPVRKENTK